MKYLTQISSFMLILTCMVMMKSSCTESRYQDFLHVAGEITDIKLSDSQNTIAFITTERDVQFLKVAAEFHLGEVSLGKLAQLKGDPKSVEEFGQKMERVHSKSLERLRNLAASKEILIPSSESEETQETMIILYADNGLEFGNKYSEISIKNHERAIEIFEKAEQDTKDVDIREYAGETIETIKDQIKFAEAFKQKYGK